ncbi:hypothetical protein GJU43_05100 [Flavobacterium sp. LC2016-23]|uniref:hypothetical protein n=1 Tax=Flavobacterium sp. LC2016-23 TaxID=2666330 RepID=UPI0012AEF88C|nr:hypothetical protein [Flavobacterium sp. LC2016-23]MRX38641.1 hypothetical protein [Flavobacterium sp. LC2016-23]
MKREKSFFAGSTDEAKKININKTKMKNLKGKIMLPVFIDAQNDVMSNGFQALSANLLPVSGASGNGVNVIISLVDNCMPNGQNKFLTMSRAVYCIK